MKNNEQGPRSMKSVRWWSISGAVSLVLIVLQVSLWMQMDNFAAENAQEIKELDTNPFLKKNWEDYVTAKNGTIEPTLRVKTGIFIQSLHFHDSTEVQLTGYIWQRYQDGLHDSIKPKPGEVGFVLPQEVNSNFEPQEAYRVRSANEEVIGWYFEASLRQPFDYSTYPFDHTKVAIRLWHKLFSRNVVLVPDFAAYTGAGHTAFFGIEKNIVLNNWERGNTYFGYSLSNYDTDFGIPNYVGQQSFPELNYNFVVKRKFQNAFIVYLLPLLLVAMLLFAALLTNSNKAEDVKGLGSSVSGFIGTASALFFVVMLAHIQLRGQFAGNGIVYIEYFYILMYVLLVLATANTYIFAIRPKRGCGFILYQDNIVIKAGYWPVVLGSLVLITLSFL
jgi:hypothetical protein